MSKRFAKVLTICSLILVIAATVVGSALCLSTIYAYDVVVDSIIENNDTLGFASSKVLINGEETSKVKVKKNSEVTITFKYDDVNCTNGRIFAGDKGSYNKDQAIEVAPEGNEVSYTTTVTKNMNFTVVHTAYDFFTVQVSADIHDTEGNVKTDVTGINVEVDKALSTNIIEKGGKLYAQANTNVVLKQTTGNALYDFSGWKVNNVDLGKGESNAWINNFNIVANTTVVGRFDEFEANNIIVEVKYEGDVKPADVGVTAGPIIDVIENDKAKVSHEDGTLVWSVRKNVGAITFQAQECEGFTFVGWSTEDANYNNDKHFNVGDVTENKTIYVKFAVLKYNVTYKTQNAEGEQSETVSVNYNSTLKAGTDYYNNGLNKFVGWTYNNETYDSGAKLAFAASGDYEFVAKYQEQKNANYKIVVTDAKAEQNTLAYNTTTGFGQEVATPENAYFFYNFAGIKLNGVVYNNINSTFAEGLEIKEQFDRALAEYGMEGDVTVEVEGIWEWTFKSLSANIFIKGDQQGTIPFTKNEDLGAKNVYETIKRFIPEGRELKEIEVSSNTFDPEEGGGIHIKKDACQKYSFNYILNMLTEDEILPDADITLTITFTLA